MPRLIENLVFEGGGVRGIAYAGAVGELERRGLLAGVKRFAGASAGAVTAALLAAGATAGQLAAIIKSTPWTAFEDHGWLPFAQVNGMLHQWGWYEGAAFERWIQRTLRDLVGGPDYDVTFADLARAEVSRDECRGPNQRQKQEAFCLHSTLDIRHSTLTSHSTLVPAYFLRPLAVTATNLTTGQAEVFSADTTPDLLVYQAVRASAGLPLYWQRYQNGGDYYVDGGCSWNYPIDIFDDSTGTPNPATLGFRLNQPVPDSGSGPADQLAITDLKSYCLTLIDFWCAMANRSHLHPADAARTVFIPPTAGVAATTFDFTPDQAAAMIEAGRQATAEFLEVSSDECRVSNQEGIRRP